MTDIVGETLREWRSGAFVYGQTDCMLSIGRYLARTGHVDVTPQFIGRYDDQAGALAQMMDYGGVPGLMAMAGAAPLDGCPSRGDVIEVMYEDDESLCSIGGLCTGDAVALRLERGMVELSLRFIRFRGAWHGSRGAA
ncbi:DUF6950 family protein [Sphingomonas aquatilis]